MIGILMAVAVMFGGGEETVAVSVDTRPTPPIAAPSTGKPFVIIVGRDGGLSLGFNTYGPNTLATLVREVDTVTGGDRAFRLWIRADPDAPYGAVVAVITTLNQAGYRDVRLIEPDGMQ